MRTDSWSTAARRSVSCGLLLCALAPGVAFAWDPPAYDLGEVLFISGEPSRDNDQDGLKDDLEYVLAETFKPRLVFDSSEHHRRDNEPVTLFQVRPQGCMGAGCPAPGVQTVVIQYAFLFQTDGGYGPSSDCSDAHNGDNQSATFALTSADGRVWKPVSVAAWKDPFNVPGGPAGNDRHLNIYMSAHKHHQYIDTLNDEKDSVYSDYGCNDDVNGRGAQILPVLKGEICRKLGIDGDVQRVGCSDLPYNVGEPEAHSAAFFMGALDSFGYTGENAWSDKRFKGGLNDDHKDTSSLRSMWMGHPFTFGPRFAGYLPPGRLSAAVSLPALAPSMVVPPLPLPSLLLPSLTP